MNSNIKKIEKTSLNSVFEDGSSINKNYIKVVFEDNGIMKNNSVKVKITDIDFDDIDFADITSISNTMKQAAYDLYAVKVASYLVDLEEITGDFNIHWDVDGDDIYDFDVCQFTDLLNYMPIHERGNLARELLKNKGFSLENENPDADVDNDSSEQKIYLKYYDYNISEIEEFIETLEKVGVVKIPAGDGEFDTVMKGRDYFFINNVEFDGAADEAVIYAISELGTPMDLNKLKKYLLELQEENEEYYEEAENEEIVGDDKMNGKFEIIMDDDLNCMNGWDSDYYLGFKLLWDNETVLLDNTVYFENPYFDDPDCDNKEEIIKDYEEAFEKAYVNTLVKELGVFGIAYNFIESELQKQNSEKRFDGSYKTDWADIKEDDFIEMKLSELVNLTDEDVERIIREDYEEECSLLEDARRDYEHEMAEREKELKEEFGF